MSIVSNLKDDFDEFHLTNDDDVSSYPMLRDSTNSKEKVWRVLIEGIEIMSAKDLLDAFVGLLATYYIFNLAYPLTLSSSLSFFQFALLKINDSEGKKSPKIKKFMNKLNTSC